MYKLNSIHYLRGIAALLVVAFHAKFMLNDTYSQINLGNLLFQSGEAGVDLFFIISGFIIALSTEKYQSASSFVIKRFFRIYPVFFICLIFVAIMKYGQYDITRLFTSLLLIQSNYSAAGPTFGYNLLYPAWTLTFEIYFYLVFMISMWINQRHRVLISISFIIIPFVILQNTFINEINLNGRLSFATPNGLGFLKVPASPMMIEFVYGLLAYYIYRYHKLTINFGTFITCLIIYGCSLSSGYRYGPGPVNFGMCAGLVIAASILYEKKHAIRNIKPLAILGDISYSLYLVHTIVLELMIRYETSIPIYSQSKGFTKLTLFIMTSIILSLFFYKYIEKPMIGLSRRFLKKHAA